MGEQDVLLAPPIILLGNSCPLQPVPAPMWGILQFCPKSREMPDDPLKTLIFAALSRLPPGWSTPSAPSCYATVVI